MKMNIFYDNGREMDIVQITDSSPYEQLQKELKKMGIEPKKIVYGYQVWGWEKAWDAHIITKDLEWYELAGYKSLYPRGEYKIKGGVKVEEIS